MLQLVRLCSILVSYLFYVGSCFLDAKGNEVLILRGLLRFSQLSFGSIFADFFTVTGPVFSFAGCFRYLIAVGFNKD